MKTFKEPSTGRAEEAPISLNGRKYFPLARLLKVILFFILLNITLFPLSNYFRRIPTKGRVEELAQGKPPKKTPSTQDPFGGLYPRLDHNDQPYQPKHLYINPFKHSHIKNVNNETFKLHINKCIPNNLTPTLQYLINTYAVSTPTNERPRSLTNILRHQTHKTFTTTTIKLQPLWSLEETITYTTITTQQRSPPTPTTQTTTYSNQTYLNNKNSHFKTQHSMNNTERENNKRKRPESNPSSPEPTIEDEDLESETPTYAEVASSTSTSIPIQPQDHKTKWRRNREEYERREETKANNSMRILHLEKQNNETRQKLAGGNSKELHEQQIAINQRMISNHETLNEGTSIRMPSNLMTDDKPAIIIYKIPQADWPESFYEALLRRKQLTFWDRHSELINIMDRHHLLVYFQKEEERTQFLLKYNANTPIDWGKAEPFLGIFIFYIRKTTKVSQDQITTELKQITGKELHISLEPTKIHGEIVDAFQIQCDEPTSKQLTNQVLIIDNQPVGIIECENNIYNYSNILQISGIRQHSRPVQEELAQIIKHKFPRIRVNKIYFRIDKRDKATGTGIIALKTPSGLHQLLPNTIPYDGGNLTFQIPTNLTKNKFFAKNLYKRHQYD